MKKNIKRLMAFLCVLCMFITGEGGVLLNAAAAGLTAPAKTETTAAAGAGEQQTTLRPRLVQSGVFSGANQTARTQVVKAADGNTYRVRVSWDKSAKIPSEADLVISEITRDADPNYDTYMAMSSELLGDKASKIVNASVFDIALKGRSTGRLYEPATEISVEFTLLTKVNDEIKIDVVHFVEEKKTAAPQADAPVDTTAPAVTDAPEETAVSEQEDQNEYVGAPELEETETEGRKVSFKTNGFSVYVVMQTTLSQRLVASDGNEYEITVRYGENSGIPSDAKLKVRELTEKDEIYDEYVDKTAETLGKDKKLFGFARAFDISIIDAKTGKHYQPNDDVTVSIRLLSEKVDKSKLISVVHFPESLEKAKEEAELAEGVSVEYDHEQPEIVEETVKTETSEGEEPEKTVDTKSEEKPEEKPAEPEVMECAVFEDAIEFDAKSFSVYVVVDNVPTRTYRFVKDTAVERDTDGKILSWKNEYTQFRQVLIKDDTLIQPANPAEDGREFRYWKKVTVENDNPVVGGIFEGWGKITDIKESYEEDAEGNIIVENDEVILVADFTPEKVAVTYYDQNGAILRKLNIDKGSEYKPNDTDALNYIGYTPIQNEEGSYLVFQYWTDAPYGGSPKAETLTATDNIDLYPVVLSGHNIYFNSNSAAISVSASYVGSVFVGPDSKPALTAAEQSAIIPKATGYDFLGWYIVSDNTRNDDKYRVFNSDGTLNDLGWNSLLTKSGDAGLTYDPTLYAHWRMSTNPVPYTVVYYAQKSSCEWDTPARISYTDENGEEASDYVFVMADKTARTAVPGTTVNRATLGMTESDLLNLVFTEKNVGSTYVNDRTGFQLSSVNNSDYEVAPDGSTVLYVYFDRKTITMTFTYNKSGNDTNNSYGRYYDSAKITFADGVQADEIKALYGHLIKDKFPVSLTQRESTSSSMRNARNVTYATVSWSDKTNPQWFPEVFATTNSMPARNLSIAKNRTLSSAKTNLYYLQIVNNTTDHYAANPNETVVVNGGTYNRFVKIGNVVYEYDRYLTHSYNFITDPEEYFDIEGFAKDRANNDPLLDRKKIGDEYKEVGYEEGRATATGYTLYKLFYTRNQWTVHLVDPMDHSQDRDVTFYYEEKINESDPKLAQFTMVKNMQRKSDDYYWFYDAACTDPVDFSDLRMPNHEMTFYAGLKYSYYIKMYPDGGEMLASGSNPWSETGNDYTTWFRLDKGEEFTSDFSGIKRDFVAVNEVAAGETAYVYEFYPFTAEDATRPKDQRQRYALYRVATTAEMEDDTVQKYVYIPGSAYTFVGWFKVNVPASCTTDEQVTDYVNNYKIPDNAKPFNFHGNDVEGEIVLKAKWRPVSKFHIVYEAGDGVRVPTDNESYVLGAKARVLLSVDQPLDKQFRGWQVKRGSAVLSTIYQPNSLLEISEELSEVASDGSRTITLVAVYKDGKFKDNYTADYKFMAPDTDGNYYMKELQTLSPGETLVRPDNPDVPEGSSYDGYEFTGWYSDPECKTLFYGFGYISLPRDTTLYAGYARLCTVTYYDAKKENDQWVIGDNILTVEKYAYNTPLTTEKVSYEYDAERYVQNWHVCHADGSGLTEAAYLSSNTGVKVTEDMILWPAMQDHAMLRFNSNGGSYVPPVKIPTDPARWPSRPQEPKRAGYQFLGWFTAPTMMVDESNNIIRTDEYDFDKPLPKDEGGKTIDVLYAWWRIEGNTDMEAEYTVIWWAQTATGGMDYEFQKSIKCKGIIGRTVDVTAASWKSQNGNVAVDSVDNLLACVERDEKEYFEYTHSGTPDSIKAVSRVTDPTAIIQDDGSTVINVYFHRARFTYQFNTRGPNGTGSPVKDYAVNGDVYCNYLEDVNGEEQVVRHSFNNTDTFKITVWLNKTIETEWPIVTDSREGITDSPWVVMKTGKSFYSWYNGSLPAPNSTSLKAYASKSDLQYADSSKTLTFELRAATLSNTYTFRYFFEEVEDATYRQVVNSSLSSLVNGEFISGLNAKSFDGYELITKKEDALDPEKKHYNYSNYARLETVSSSFTETVTLHHYGLKDDRANDYWVWIQTDLLGLFGEYCQVGIDDDGTGNLNSYRTYYTRNGKKTYFKASSYTLYVTAKGSGNPGNNARTVSADTMFNDALNHWTTTGTITHTGGIKYANFYYKPIVYNVVFLNNDSTPYVVNGAAQKIGVKYGAYVPDEMGKAGIPDPVPPANMEFAGWSVSPDTTIPYLDNMPARDLTLYATFRPLQVRVTTRGYDADGNRIGDDELDESYFVEKDYNTILNNFSFSDPKMEPGFSFIGWRLWENDAVGNRISINDPVTRNITIVPEMEDLRAAPIIYVLNGGSLKTGRTTITGTTPTEGNFAGDGTYLIGASATIVEGRADIAKYEDDMEFPFVTWNTRADGRGTDYYPGDLVKVGKTSLVLYAQYKQSRRITLVYHLNLPDGAAGSFRYEDDGSVITGDTLEVTFKEVVDYSVTSQEQYPNKKVMVCRDADDRSFKAVCGDYEFENWSVNADGSGKRVNSFSIIRVDTTNPQSDGAVHLYAQWSKKTPTAFTVQNVWYHEDGTAYDNADTDLWPRIKFTLIGVPKQSAEGPMGVPMDNGFLWPSYASDFPNAEDTDALASYTSAISATTGLFKFGNSYYAVYGGINTTGTNYLAGPNSAAFADSVVKFTGKLYSPYAQPKPDVGYLRGDVYFDTLTNRYYIRTAANTEEPVLMSPIENPSGWVRFSAGTAMPDMTHTNEQEAISLEERMTALYGSSVLKLDSDDYILQFDKDESQSWKCVVEGLSADYVYFVVESLVGGDDVTKLEYYPSMRYDPKYEYSGTMTKVSNRFDPIARVSSDDGEHWTYHDCMEVINNDEYGKPELGVSALDRASALSGNIIIETLRETADYTTNKGTVNRYTLFSQVVIPANVTIRTTQDTHWNDGGKFRTTLYRGSANSGSMFSVGASKSLTTENIIIDGASSSVSADGGVMNVAASGTLTLNGGTTIQNASVGSGKKGGAVYVTAGGKLDIKGTEAKDGGVEFNSCSAGNSGGAVYVAAGGMLDVKGKAANLVEFIDCSAGNGGGAINVNEGTKTTDFSDYTESVNIEYCSFTNCSASGTTDGISAGGAIRCMSKTFKIDHCAFSGCKTVQQGGAVYHLQDSKDSKVSGTKIEALNCTFTSCKAGVGNKNAASGGLETQALSVTVKDCTFTSCESNKNAGALNVYREGSTINVENTVFTGCKANGTGNEGNGGALRTTGSSTTVKDCTFNNCEAKRRGGAIHCKTNTTIKGTTVISGCKAVDVGGGAIYLENGKLTVSAGTITGCEAPDGGSVYQAGGTLNFEGGSITGSKAKGKNGYGGGVYLGGTSSKVNLLGGTIQNCEAKTGGGVFQNSGTLTFSSGSIEGCKASSNGGGVYIGGGELNIINSDSAAIKACEANNGGGVYLNGTNTTLNIGEDGKTTGGAVTGCTASNNGGGIYQSNGTLRIYNGTSIDSNTASGSGGGVYLGGGEFYISGTTPAVTGNTAKNGGGLYVKEGSSSKYTEANIYGGSITENTATVEGGGIATGSQYVRLQFQGNITVWNNTLKTSPTADAVPCNVCLNQDSNGVINTTSVGLSVESHIGVYVKDGSTLSGKHGTWGLPFGTYDNSEGSHGYENLSRFINDRTEYYSFYYGVRHPNDDNHYIYWADYTCKITDESGTLLFTNNKHTAPALYKYLGKDGAFAALNDATLKFYYENGAEATPARVEMLVDHYDLKWEDTISLTSSYPIKLTTASSNKDDLNKDRNHLYGPYDGTAESVCVIGRGDCTASMFNIGSGSSLTLENVTIDGGATYNSAGANTGKTGSGSGGLFSVYGSLTVGSGATLQNSEATAAAAGSTAIGGAVYVNGGTLNVTSNGKITGSRSANGGAVDFAGLSSKLNLSGSAFIYDNKTADGAQKNVVIDCANDVDDVDSWNINVTSAGLNTDAKIGVYATDTDVDVDKGVKVFNLHGDLGEPFGVYGKSDNMNCFYNDRINDVNGDPVRGVVHADTDRSMVFWPNDDAVLRIENHSSKSSMWFKITVDKGYYVYKMIHGTRINAATINGTWIDSPVNGDEPRGNWYYLFEVKGIDDTPAGIEGYSETFTFPAAAGKNVTVEVYLDEAMTQRVASLEANELSVGEGSVPYDRTNNHFSATLDKDEATVISLTDAGYNFTFLKVDGNGNPLAGAVFQLFENEAATDQTQLANGSAITATSAADGTVELVKLPRRTEPYYMKETTVPVGYSADTIYRIIVNAADDWSISRPVLNDDGTIKKNDQNETVWEEVSKNKDNQYVIMNAFSAERRVVLKKVRMTDSGRVTNTPLEGARFRIFRADLTEVIDEQPVDADGKRVGYYESSDSGVYFIGTLPRGLYYLVETKAPTGAYSSNQGKVFELRVEDKMVRQIETENYISATSTNQVLRTLYNKVQQS